MSWWLSAPMQAYLHQQSNLQELARLAAKGPLTSNELATVAASFVVAVGVYVDLLGMPSDHRSHVVTLYSWLPVGTLPKLKRPAISVIASNRVPVNQRRTPPSGPSGCRTIPVRRERRSSASGRTVSTIDCR